MSSTPPKKYVKINGIMKLNPEYKKWKEQQSMASTGQATPATTALSDQAIPVVSSMEDHAQMNEDFGQEVPLAEATNATIEMLQEPEISLEAGLQPDQMIDELGMLLARYEIPIGLTNKLMMLSEFASLEFIIDDSGSMQMQSDTINPITKRANTRWGEAQERLKEMIEILAYVPFQQIGIEFLNRKDRIALARNGRDPKTFLADANAQIDAVFARPPAGTTPALEKLQESFMRGQGASIARYFFGDGLPNGGITAINEITKILKNRSSPEMNPMTFISCTNEDEAVEWMKDAEEVAPYCSESDDFNDEAREVLRDQGVALPYTKGFHLICQLVAAMNPDDLDAMDESVPFTKFTLDNLLGVVNNPETYQHYFNSFLEAQKKRTVETDPRTGQPKQSDIIKKNTQWNYNDFLTANGPAKTIPHVQQVLQQIKSTM